MLIYGYYPVRDTILLYPTKGLYSGQWISSQYGTPPLKIETPEVLERFSREEKNIEQLINNMKPPIFWKDKETIRQQIIQWNPKKLNEAIIDLAKLKSVAYVKYFNNLFYEYNKLFRTFQFDQKADIIRFEFQNWKNEIEKLNPDDLLSETQCNKIALDAQKWLSELKELLKAAGKPVSGKKAELIERLSE